MDQDENKPAPESQDDQHVIAEYYEGVQRLELDTAEGRIRKARNAIFAIAILQLISELLGMSMANTFTLSDIAGIIGDRGDLCRTGFPNQKATADCNSDRACTFPGPLGHLRSL